MRNIIVHFLTVAHVNTFLKKFNIPEVQKENIKEINIVEKAVVYKNPPRYTSVKDVSWKKEWFSMPEMAYVRPTKYIRVPINFPYFMTNSELSAILEQKITSDTRVVYYPKKERGSRSEYQFIGGDSPKYPVYIVSKGRSWLKKLSTSYHLSSMRVQHYMVVEPDELKVYQENFSGEYCTVIPLDMTYKEKYDRFMETPHTTSTGPGPARNFCWDHSIAQGFAYHWVLDDNIAGFMRYWGGKRYRVKTGAIMRACEEFTERYENIAISGPNYAGFCADGDDRPAYRLNTRIYSCLFIRNDIPYRWRGVYNEDTDLCIRALKDNWCTVLFQFFLADKVKTQELKGGNTEEFYEKEGTGHKSFMLVDMHPDITETAFRYGRIHHKVDYSGFTQELKLRDGVERIDTPNEYGMYLEKFIS